MVSGSAVYLCEVLVGALIGTMIGAFILKSSCALYNLLAGAWARSSSTSAPRPPDTVPETRITREPGSGLVLKEDWVPRQKIETAMSVPKPSFEWAMCIVFTAALVNVLVYFLALRLLRLAGTVAGHHALGSLTVAIIFYPNSFLILSGILAAMLPTRFGKGLLISLICLFLSALVAGVLFVVSVLVTLIFGPDALRFGL